MTFLQAETSQVVLIVTHEVLQALANFAQYFPHQPEQGGVLIGHFPETPHQQINITQWTTPQEGDEASRFRFYRSAEAHMKLVHDAWEASDHTLTYVGEWHTHPEDHPQYSTIDLKFWREATREFTYHGEGLVFIIVGTVSTRGWYMARGADLPELVFETITPIPDWSTTDG